MFNKDESAPVQDFHRDFERDEIYNDEDDELQSEDEIEPDGKDSTKRERQRRGTCHGAPVSTSMLVISDEYEFVHLICPINGTYASRCEFMPYCVYSLNVLR